MRRITLALREISRRIERLIPWLSYEQRLRFRVVEDGKLYRSAQPTEEALEYFRKKYGIQSLVIVLKRPEQYELDFARRNSIKVHHIALSHRHPTEEEVKEFLEFVSVSENQPILLHCMAGKDRTGGFSLLYRVEITGWSPRSAWNEMRRLGHCAFPGELVRFSHFREWLEKRYSVKLN